MFRQSIETNEASYKIFLFINFFNYGPISPDVSVLANKEFPIIS